MDTAPTTAVATMDDIGQGPLARLQRIYRTGTDVALAIMIDPELRAAAQFIADQMSKAVGYSPRHCIDRTELCFAITVNSMVWRLNPFAVAQKTYQPNEEGKVAYEAVVVQSIMEASGRLDGEIKREYFGDWSKIEGRFKFTEEEKEFKSKYPDKRTGEQGTYKKKIRLQQQLWTDEDEMGVGIRVSARIKGEAGYRDPVELNLRSCWPRNSTLWVLEPKRQIYYRAVRMLASMVIPSAIMGVPFRGEEPEDLIDDTPRGRASRAREINPQQRARDAARGSAAPEEGVELTDAHGEVRIVPAGEVEPTVAAWVKEATDDELEALIENNPDMAYMIELADMEREGRRAEADAAKHDDPDPLKLENVKGAIGFLSVLRVAMENASAADADRYWTIYKEKAKRADEKAQAGDYASLQALVTAKIEGRA